MSEAARIILEILRLGRTPAALLARAAMAEQRGLELENKAKRVMKKNKRRAERIFRRAHWWQDRAEALRARARG